MQCRLCSSQDLSLLLSSLPSELCNAHRSLYWRWKVASAIAADKAAQQVQ